MCSTPGLYVASRTTCTHSSGGLARVSGIGGVMTAGISSGGVMTAGISRGVTGTVFDRSSERQSRYLTVSGCHQPHL